MSHRCVEFDRAYCEINFGHEAEQKLQVLFGVDEGAALLGHQVSQLHKVAPGPDLAEAFLGQLGVAGRRHLGLDIPNQQRDTVQLPRRVVDVQQIS